MSVFSENALDCTNHVSGDVAVLSSPHKNETENLSTNYRASLRCTVQTPIEWWKAPSIRTKSRLRTPTLYSRRLISPIDCRMCRGSAMCRNHWGAQKSIVERVGDVCTTSPTRDGGALTVLYKIGPRFECGVAIITEQKKFYIRSTNAPRDRSGIKFR